MRFMLLMIPDVYQKSGAPSVPPADAIAKMMAFNEDLAKAGVLLSLDGLRPPDQGARLHFSGDGKRPKVVDGPFSESKEVLGGFWILQVKSRDEAIEWASRVPAAAGDVIEVRQIQEMSDFPDMPPISDELAKVGKPG